METSGSTNALVGGWVFPRVMVVVAVQEASQSFNLIDNSTHFTALCKDNRYCDLGKICCSDCDGECKILGFHENSFVKLLTMGFV